MSFKISTFFPEHLDLNGDQANLIVASKRLEWLGYEVEISAIEKGAELPSETDLIFVGHGSLAAWADINESMTDAISWISNSVQKGCGLMAVASGQEWAIRSGLLAGGANPTERISKFEIAEIEGLEILGYLNSSTSAPVIQKNGHVLGTQLHGPVLAKNPEFADSYLLEIAAARGILKNSAKNNNDLKSNALSNNHALSNNSDLVAGIVKQVWELERDLASE
jgi:CobQ-like glutamine amidotransferase family enzyme